MSFPKKYLADITTIIVISIFLLISIYINIFHITNNYEYFGLFRILRELMLKNYFFLVSLIIWFFGFLVYFKKNKTTINNKCFKKKSFFLFLFILLLFSSVGYPYFFIDKLSLSILIFAIIISSRNENLKTISYWKNLYMLLVLLVAYNIVAYCHTMIKAILFYVMQPVDTVLWSLENNLIIKNYYQWMQDWRIKNINAVKLLDEIYIGLLQQICWAGLFFYASKDWVNAKKYFYAIIYIYILGPPLYFFIPSLGPLFYQPSLFNDLLNNANHTIMLSQFLWENHTDIVEQHFVRISSPFGYIAAFPSLHVGIAVIILLSMKNSIPMFIFNLGLLFFTIIATNVLGWHYITDAIAGIFLGWLCWILSSKLIDFETKTIPPK